MRLLPVLALGVIPLLWGCAQVTTFLTAQATPPARFKPQSADDILRTLDAAPAVPQSAAVAREVPAQPLPVTAVLGAPAAPPRALHSVVAPLSVPVSAPVAVPQAQPAQPPRPAGMLSREEVQQAVEAWREAWERGDTRRYLQAYHASFKGDLGSREEWERQRQARLANGNIRVAIAGVRVSFPRDGEANIVFLQHYASGRHADVGEKRLRLRREAEGWRIVQEGWAHTRT
jgi:hypothetical protein